MTIPGDTRRVRDDGPLSGSPAGPFPMMAGLAAVFVLSVVSRRFAPEGSEVAVWWPAAGVSVMLLVLAGRSRHLPLAAGVAACVGLAVHTAGASVEEAAGIGLSDAVEAFVVARLLTGRGLRRPALKTLEDMQRLVLATIAGALLCGLGVAATVTGGLDGRFVLTALTVFASHAAAILILTPLASDTEAASLSGRTAELLLQVALLLLAAGYIFSPGQVLGLPFLPLPLLLWAALRFGLRTVSVELIALGVLTTVLTDFGGGPFALGVRDGVAVPAVTAALVQVFLIVSALVTLPTALAVEQRRVAVARLAQSEELFHKSFSESFVGMLLLHLAPDGLRIRDLNATAAAMLGRPPGDLVERRFAPMLEPGSPVDEIALRLSRGELAGWRDELWLAEAPQRPERRVGLALSALSTPSEVPMFSAQILDVTDVRDATSHLRREKDFNAAVLNTTACLIVVVGVDGTIVGMNPAVARATGVAEDRLVGRPLWDALVSGSDEPAFQTLIDDTMPGLDAPTVEGDLVTGTGPRRRVVWTGAPLADEHGRRRYVVLTGIDITEELNMRSIAAHLLDAATTVAFIGLDLDGTITVFNTGAERLLGYDASEVRDRMRLADLRDPSELAERGGEALTALVGGVESQPRTEDWTYLRKDGSRVICSVTMSAVRDAFGTLIGYLAVGSDVTESREAQRVLEETLEKKRETLRRLQELDRAKSEFVSMVSHELRTPITSIVGYTELLQEGAAGPVTDEQDGLLDAVRRNGERLVALIEDLLTLSRIEAGTFTLEKQSIDLSTVLHRAREALAPMLSGRRLDVVFDLPDAPVQIVGDPGELERVVLNLVGNAVKFTEDGGAVRCSLSADVEAEIRVVDTGIGIPDDEQDALFTRFFRSRVAQERAIQGTGLGLSIVQSIVHSHGGRIDIRSRYGVGTDVRVRVPLASAGLGALPGVAAGRPAASGAQRSDS